MGRKKGKKIKKNQAKKWKDLRNKERKAAKGQLISRELFGVFQIYQKNKDFLKEVK